MKSKQIVGHAYPTPSDVAAWLDRNKPKWRISPLKALSNLQEARAALSSKKAGGAS